MPADTIDATKSPIAALLAAWRQLAEDFRLAAAKRTTARATLLRQAARYDAQANKLEAAITAQVEWLTREAGHPYTHTLIGSGMLVAARLLKGES